jgi:hypothetical protein
MCPFRLQRHSFITTLFLGPFDDVITKFYCIYILSRIGRISRQITPCCILYSEFYFTFALTITQMTDLRLLLSAVSQIVHSKCQNTTD